VESPTSRNSRGLSIFCDAIIALTTWHFPRATVVGPVEGRHAGVAGDRQPGPDLFEVRAAVLRVPELQRWVVGVDLLVGPYSEIEVISQ
jgi:hypothetical protein